MYNAAIILNLIADKYGIETKISRNGNVIRYTVDGVTLRVTIGDGDNGMYGTVASAKVLEFQGHKDSDDSAWVYEWAPVGGYIEKTGVWGYHREQALLGFAAYQLTEMGERAEVNRQRRAS